MERYTIREGGAVSVSPEHMEAALERLARFEDMALGLEREREEISGELASLRDRRKEKLRGERKEKTVQFRELLARKLTGQNMLLLLERWQIR